MRPVCLITPPSTFLLDERIFPSLGVLRVAAVLRQAGHEVEHLDLSGVSNFEEAAADHAGGSAAAVFGITATTPQMPAARRVALRLRLARPDARIVLGGPHATLVNAARKIEAREGRRGRAHEAFEALYGSLADVVVAGDGEFAVFAALADDAPSLVDADDPGSKLWLDDGDYESLPFPARDLLDLDSYRYEIEGERALSMIAQLGCPYGCGFCGGRDSPFLRRIRTRSTASVLREVREVVERYGARGVMMYDDELNVSRSCVELMRGIAALSRELAVPLRLRGFVKANLFTDEQAEAMAAAGFRWVLVGFESGSPRILANIEKKATREENTRCLAIARRHGLKVKALMSIGHPGESEATVRETREWLLAERPDDFDATVICAYPGTPYYDRAVRVAADDDVYLYVQQKSRDRLYMRDVDYSTEVNAYKGIPGDYRAFVWTDTLRPNDLVRLRDALESEVRAALDIPFNRGAPGVRYEASMGQLPGFILRRSA